MLNEKKDSASDWLGPLLVIFTGLSWSAFYVFTTRNDPLQDEATLALMLPLLFALIPISLFAGYSSLSTRSHVLDPSGSHGLNDYKRQAYLLATSLYLLALSQVGFLGSSLFFFLGLSWYLGTRSLWALVFGASLLIMLIYVGFFTLLSVDLPLF